MKNTPFKMQGFSGFGNSPLKTEGHGGTEGHAHSRDLSSGGLMRNERGGGTRPKNKKKKKSFKYTKLGKFFSRLVGKGGMRTSSNRKPKTTKLGCGPGSCPG